jgi:hypothetical protein
MGVVTEQNTRKSISLERPEMPQVLKGINLEEVQMLLSPQSGCRKNLTDSIVNDSIKAGPGSGSDRDGKCDCKMYMDDGHLGNDGKMVWNPDTEQYECHESSCS